MVRRLYVHICNAIDLMPRDGGSVSAYCILSFDGQALFKTEVKHKDLNPVWNSKFQFEISADALADKYLDVSVYNKSSKPGRNDASLGRVKIHARSLLKGPHRQPTVQELKPRNFFSSAKGGLKLLVWWSDDKAHTPPAHDQQVRSVDRASAPQLALLNDVVTITGERSGSSTFTAESSSSIHTSLLIEASNMILQISIAARKAKVNFRQCNLLSLVCKLGDVSIETWKLAKLKDCTMAVSQLLWVLKRARKLVDECSNENWQWLAAVKFDRTWEVAEILQELMMCVEILNFIAMKHNNEEWMMNLLNGDIEGMVDLNCLDKCVNEDKRQRAEQISNADIAAYMSKREILPPQLPELKPDAVKIIYPNRLGGGTYGDVYEGKWLGKPVAVKVLKGIQHSEVEFVSGLPYSSPHILQSIGYYDSRGRTHMVMELMRMDLLRFIRLKSPLSLILSIDIILQIAKGIEYMHDNNIAHRDLKPENILVDFEDIDDAHCIIKLVDFGTSKLNFNSEATYNTSPVGTLIYMAPELLKGDVRYGKSVELYSFAVICSVLLTGGVVPFSNTYTRRELYTRLKKGERPGLPRDCPPILSALIRECWKFEPLERPSIFQVTDILRGLKARILRGCPKYPKNVLGCSDLIGIFWLTVHIWKLRPLTWLRKYTKHSTSDFIEWS